MDINELIRSRRSIRCYTDELISRSKILKLVEAAICAPSGKNGQPWRYAITMDSTTIERISSLTIYESWMKTAKAFISVYLDTTKSYHYVKDIQSIGAAIQNILLMAHSEGLGTCWNGEIIKKSKQVNEILDINGDQYELMAVIAIGYPNETPIAPYKNDVSSYIINHED